MIAGTPSLANRKLDREAAALQSKGENRHIFAV